MMAPCQGIRRGHRAVVRGSGVSARSSCALEVGQLQLSVRARETRRRRPRETRETHFLDALDVGHEERARAVGFLDVDGVPEADFFASDPRGLAADAS